MDKEISIGIVYRKTKSWIAGAYYIQNIITSLLSVKNVTLPRIFLFCETHDDFEELRDITAYPKLEEIRFYSTGKGVVGFIDKVFRHLFRQKTNLINTLTCRKYGLKFIFPSETVYLRENKGGVAWIPDFQEMHMPELFSEEAIRLREEFINGLVNTRTPIVFSSQDALNDFKRRYDYTKVKTFVLPFSVCHPDYSNENIDDLKNKFQIKGSYLFCANQFWAHKNHKVLFEGYNLARLQGLKLQLVCTGQMRDDRNKHYNQELRDFITRNGLEEDIKILGFIERTEMLCLMKNAYAVVQPSLFEGWNTTVEDVKCMNKFIFLSDLSVHREQSPVNVCYFNPHDPNDLSRKLLTTQPTEVPYDYNINVKCCGEKFMEIIERV